MKTLIKDRQSFWRYLTNFWTIIFFIVIIADFLNENLLVKNDILLPVAVIYGAVLAMYSAEKEFKRWHDMHTSRHPGEVYTIIWTVLIVAILVGKLVFHIEYHMPPEVSSAYVVVIGVLAITKESKYLHRVTKKKK